MTRLYEYLLNSLSELINAFSSELEIELKAFREKFYSVDPETLNEYEQIWHTSVNAILSNQNLDKKSYMRDLIPWHDVLVCLSEKKLVRGKYIRCCDARKSDDYLLVTKIFCMAGLDLTEGGQPVWFDKLLEESAFEAIQFLLQRVCKVPLPDLDGKISDDVKRDLLRVCYEDVPVSLDLLRFLYRLEWPGDDSAMEALKNLLTTFIQGQESQSMRQNLKDSLLYLAITHRLANAIPYLSGIGARIITQQQVGEVLPDHVMSCFDQDQQDVAVCRAVLNSLPTDVLQWQSTQRPGYPLLPVLLDQILFSRHSDTLHYRDCIQKLGLLIAAGVSVGAYLPEYIPIFIREACTERAVSTLLLLLIDAEPYLALKSYQSIATEVGRVKANLGAFKQAVLMGQESAFFEAHQIQTTMFTPMFEPMHKTSSDGSVSNNPEDTDEEDEVNDGTLLTADFHQMVALIQRCRDTGVSETCLSELNTIRARHIERGTWLALLHEMQVPREDALENLGRITILRVAALLNMPQAVWDIFFTDMGVERIENLISVVRQEVRHSGSTVLHEAAKAASVLTMNALSSYFQDAPLLWLCALSCQRKADMETPVETFLYWASNRLVPPGMLQAFRAPLSDVQWDCVVARCASFRKPRLPFDGDFQGDSTADRLLFLDFICLLQVPDNDADVARLRKCVETYIQGTDDPQAFKNRCLMIAIAESASSVVKLFFEMGARLSDDVLDKAPEVLGAFKGLRDVMLCWVLLHDEHVSSALHLMTSQRGYPEMPILLHAVLIARPENMKSPNLLPVLALLLVSGVSLAQYLPETLLKLIGRAHGELQVEALLLLLIEAKPLLQLENYQFLMPIVTQVSDNISAFKQAIFANQMDAFYAENRIDVKDIKQRLETIPSFDRAAVYHQDKQFDSDYEAMIEVMSTIRDCYGQGAGFDNALVRLKAIRTKHEQAGTWLAALQYQKDYHQGRDVCSGATLLHIAALLNMPAELFDAMFGDMTPEQKTCLLGLESFHSGLTPLGIAAYYGQAGVIERLAKCFAERPLLWFGLITFASRGEAVLNLILQAGVSGSTGCLLEAARGNLSDKYWCMALNRVVGHGIDKKGIERRIQSASTACYDLMKAPLTDPEATSVFTAT